jgi:hypothetical protein
MLRQPYILQIYRLESIVSVLNLVTLSLLRNQDEFTGAVYLALVRFLLSRTILGETSETGLSSATFVLLLIAFSAAC